MRRTLALAATAVLASSAAVSAQSAEKCFDKGTLTYYDCPRLVTAPPRAPVAPPAPLPPPPPLWSGAYIGLHAGYAWADFEGTYSGVLQPLDYGSLDPDGPLIGGQIGVNHQFENNIVLGAEGDFSWLFNADDRAGNSGVTPGTVTAPIAVLPGVAFGNSIKADLDWLASLRLRAGYAIDNVLPYVTGGVALAGYELSASSFAGGASFSGSTDEVAVGGVVGGGLEFMASENVVLRAEGLYYMFNDKESISGLTAASGPGDKAGIEDVIVGRVGLSYRF